ncbi:LysM peptidoglycan-binding domain-containing protein [Afifella sp. IM 167]|uniref:LysM peptidoglycan-binding domain-containing protein n=1 Tax=Afifella sp. IM 167 TaxID=2033586 RepID=UPI001CCA1EFC|nr:Ig-like domain-containing protein [Afifella sp. IM 167]MBZ8134211.1 hypothetical protein [Afifella sp. IM 167]
MPSPYLLLAILIAAMTAIGGAALLAQAPWDEKAPKEATAQQQAAVPAEKSDSEAGKEPGGETEVARTGPADEAAEGSTDNPAGLLSEKGRDAVGSLGTGTADLPDERSLGFDVVRVEPSGEALFAGRAQPNAAIEIVSNGTVIATAVADRSGAFVVMPDKPLAPGGHDLSLRLADDTGTQAEERVAVVVPEREGEDVLVVAEKPGAPSEILAKPGDRQTAAGMTGEGTAAQGTETASADAAAPSAGQPGSSASPAAGSGAQPAPSGETQELAVEAVEEETGRMYVAGAGEPGSTVRVYVDEKPLGEAKVNEGGRWLLEAPGTTEEGEVAVRADQLDESGTGVAARSEVAFSREANEAALVPVAGDGSVTASGDIAGPRSIIIRRGDNLWTLSRRNYGHGIRYTTIYGANLNQIRDPDLIYPGQVFTLPARDKNWPQEPEGEG